MTEEGAGDGVVDGGDGVMREGVGDGVKKGAGDGVREEVAGDNGATEGAEDGALDVGDGAVKGGVREESAGDRWRVDDRSGERVGVGGGWNAGQDGVQWSVD